MGDFRDMVRALQETRRLKQERRRGLMIEIASWVIVFAAIVALIMFKVLP